MKWQLKMSIPKSNQGNKNRRWQLRAQRIYQLGYGANPCQKKIQIKPKWRSLCWSLGNGSQDGVLPYTPVRVWFPSFKGRYPSMSRGHGGLTLHWREIKIPFYLHNLLSSLRWLKPYEILIRKNNHFLLFHFWIHLLKLKNFQIWVYTLKKQRDLLAIEEEMKQYHEVLQ